VGDGEADVGPLAITRAAAVSTGYGSFTRVAWLCTLNGDVDRRRRGTGIDGYMLAAPSPDSECVQVSVVQRVPDAGIAAAAAHSSEFAALGVIDMAVPRAYLALAGGGGSGAGSDSAAPSPSSIVELLRGRTGA